MGGNFFALHFGFFHFVYLIFLMSFESDADTATALGGGLHPLDFVFYAALALGFWHSHRASHLEHVEADLARVPNLGALMMLPYARVVPMHLCIVTGAHSDGGGVWLFVLLKTAADVVMHKLEHRYLQRSGLESPTRENPL